MTKTRVEMADRRGEENPGTILHIAGLHPHTREKDIRSEFSKLGDVIECRLVVDPHTGTSCVDDSLTLQRSQGVLPSLQWPLQSWPERQFKD